MARKPRLIVPLGVEKTFRWAFKKRLAIVFDEMDPRVVSISRTAKKRRGDA